jgi:YjbE family integral membrane protein
MSGIAELGWNWDFIVRFFSIVLIDICLSGDNAIVIGMAAASLDREKRKWAIMMGGGFAIALRISLTIIVTLLLQIPLLCALGGCVLFWVAWKLFRLDVNDGNSEEKPELKQSKNFRQAVILIITADFIMSLDNVIAVAGTAHGNIWLLILGLLLSMPLLMTVGGVISIFIDRFKWLVYLGAAVIIFAGTRMIFEDNFIESLLPLSSIIVITISILVGITATGLFLLINRKRI